MEGLIYKAYDNPTFGWAGWYENANGSVQAFVASDGEVVPVERIEGMKADSGGVTPE